MELPQGFRVMTGLRERRRFGSWEKEASEQQIVLSNVLITTTTQMHSYGKRVFGLLQLTQNVAK